MTPKKKPPRPHPGGSGRRPDLKVPRQRTEPQIRYVGAPKAPPKPKPPEAKSKVAPEPKPKAAPAPAPAAAPAPVAARAAAPPRPPPLPPSLAPRPRRQWHARRAVVGGILLLLVVAAITGWRLMSAGNDPAGTSDPGVRTPRPPVAVAPGTAYVETRVTGAGDLRVRHWIRTRADLFGLELAAPRASGGVPMSARARQVRVVVDGRVVQGPASVGSTTAFYTFAGTRRVFVSYRLEGAVTESPSAPGRGLARVTSLTVSYSPRPTSSTRRVVGADVLALACAAPGSDAAAVPRPCGRPSGNGWEVELGGPDVDNRVAAQFDRR